MAQRLLLAFVCCFFRECVYHFRMLRFFSLCSQAIGSHGRIFFALLLHSFGSISKLWIIAHKIICFRVWYMDTQLLNSRHTCGRCKCTRNLCFTCITVFCAFSKPIHTLYAIPWQNGLLKSNRWSRAFIDATAKWITRLTHSHSFHSFRGVFGWRWSCFIVWLACASRAKKRVSVQWLWDCLWAFQSIYKEITRNLCLRTSISKIVIKKFNEFYNYVRYERNYSDIRLRTFHFTMMPAKMS